MLRELTSLLANRMNRFFIAPSHNRVGEFGKKSCSCGFHPPLKKGGWGDFFQCYPIIADSRPKAAGCVAIRPTPSYTCGTACGEKKSSACSSIGKNPSATISLILCAGSKTGGRTGRRSPFGARTSDIRRRTDQLEQHGLRVLRFDDRQVLLQTESVLEMIFQAVKNPS